MLIYATIWKRKKSQDECFPDNEVIFKNTPPPFYIQLTNMNPKQNKFNSIPVTGKD